MIGRRHCVAFLLLGMSVSAYSYDVNKIYKKLLAANNITSNVPIYTVSAGGVPEVCSLACTDDYKTRLTVTYELLKYVINEDELAGVIGHEMAHGVYKDEMKADVLGLEYAEKAGYNKCKAAQLMKSYGADSNHPSGSKRYKNTGCK